MSSTMPGNVCQDNVSISNIHVERGVRQGLGDIIKRKGKVMVICENPKHKQRQG